jgi:hypothetical protein
MLNSLKTLRFIIKHEFPHNPHKKPEETQFYETGTKYFHSHSYKKNHIACLKLVVGDMQELNISEFSY